MSNGRHQTSCDQGISAPFAPARGSVCHNFESESLLFCGSVYSSRFRLIYFPFLILASAGFGSSSGIAHLLPIFTAPGMRSSLHKICMRRAEIPHLSAVCGTERYFITQSSKSDRLTRTSIRKYNNSVYIIIRLANKIKKFSAKFTKYFQY